jgi:hypothetical protein
MFRSIRHISKTAAVTAVAMSGLGLGTTIQAAEPEGVRGPVVKNLMSLTYRAGRLIRPDLTISLPGK